MHHKDILPFSSNVIVLDFYLHIHVCISESTVVLSM